jgi:hypothetical protein
MSVRSRVVTAAALVSFLLIAALLFRGPVVQASSRAGRSTAAAGFSQGNASLKSAGALAFGPGGVLFVGDSRGGAVYALSIDDPAPDYRTGEVEIAALDKRFAKLLGVAPDQVAVRDMAVNPATRHLFFSVTRGRAVDAQPVIVRSTLDGELSIVSTDGIRFAKYSLTDSPDESSKTPWGASARSMAITDLAYVDGELLVAGLSNEQFASTFRRVKFPFQPAAQATSLEIFHTSHGRYETAAPIETFLPYTVKGRPALLAGYGCAPLALFDMAELQGGKHVRGRTLAELGGGNRPSDMVAIEFNGRRSIIIANSNRSLMRMGADDIEHSEPVTTAASPEHPILGTPYTPLAVVGVMQLDVLNAEQIVLVLRDTDDGSIKVSTYPVKYL